MDPQLQRASALEKANAVRVERAKIKEQVALGEQDARDLLVDPPEVIEKMRVGDLLRAVRGVGEVRLRRILTAQMVSKDTVICHLSLGTRHRIARSLPRAKVSA